MKSIIRTNLIISHLFLVACGASNMQSGNTTDTLQPTPSNFNCFKDTNTCIEMVQIPGGEFMMGSETGFDNERPVHPVSVPSFYMMTTEVTRDMYKPCVDEGICVSTQQNFDQGNLPVGYTSWDDAQIYIAWLNETTGMHYRLPTEAEWEYSAHAGTTNLYSWGDTIDCSNANYWTCTDIEAPTALPVKTFSANNFGLYDMSGNVWEWVQNCSSKDYSLVLDTGNIADSTCELWSMRGGSWTDYPKSLTPTNRAENYSDYRFITFGFRLAHDK